MAADASSGFELIVGLHDLAEPAVAQGDELRSWLPASQALPLLDRILDAARACGHRLRVTADDGFRTDLDRIAPWLVDNGVPGDFFIATRLIDRPGRLDAAAVRDLHRLGFAIGLHGARHIDWSRVPEAEFVEDVREGRQALEDLIGAPVERAAPPFGGFNARVLRHLRRTGLREIHTCLPGLALASVWLKPRNMLKPGTVDTVLTTARRRGDWRDALRCRLRPSVAGIRSLVGPP